MKYYQQAILFYVSTNARKFSPRVYGADSVFTTYVEPQNFENTEICDIWWNGKALRFTVT